MVSQQTGVAAAEMASSSSYSAASFRLAACFCFPDIAERSADMRRSFLAQPFSPAPTLCFWVCYPRSLSARRISTPRGVFRNHRSTSSVKAITAASEWPMYQPKLPFVSLQRPDTTARVRRNLFPRIQEACACGVDCDVKSNAHVLLSEAVKVVTLLVIHLASVRGNKHTLHR